ncbi:DUF2806 domain-containing protein [Autumnicola musiva]|uniref:DUF2806 domain-containing protein n=1 Tax=Autumnicola musiva TaxID=3075589 RepID=A0ABU3DBG9_9FLAO|nr:DUF2806 domain-containing protein [Zunongwangia sp. F117]MDT0678816.1 DUF2806 domain-containing protein [Zunongwangia sp. F117]
MSDKIIKIKGRPLEKLVQVIKKGLGSSVTKSELRKEEEFDEGSFDNSKDLHPDSRVQERIIHKETKRQQNLDYINYIAGEQLNQDENVSDEPVDDDWIYRFFNIAEDISNEEMQLLWGRILAGEIKEPSSYSTRTLELLKNLTKEEAEIFTKFAQLKITSGDTSFIYNQDNGKFLEDEFGIKFSDRLLLTELGLIASENNLEFSFNPTGNVQMNHVLRYGRKGIVLYREQNTPKQAIKVLIFTKAGLELSRLIQPEFSLKYIRNICKGFKHSNVKIEYGDLILSPNNRFLLLNKTIFNE